MANEGHTTCELVTTTGMTISLDRYNFLVDMEEIKSRLPEGVSIIAIYNDQRIGLTLPENTTVVRVGNALVQLIGKAGKRYTLQTVKDETGVLLELPRTLKELQIERHAKLFINYLVEDSVEQATASKEQQQ